ncbi:expressed unknown protein [Seminavis robusta]|uniref:Uncharacterized protein n=1 Tax=Seminavis robusta TaxID=568900 RepID=A0A9N8HQZ2_9STRA|nr:expressed unknown protein [Seminavis robusta]|eukprot:Sro1256_g256590.1 n/a (108) ;mRNA; r:4678-5091
MSDSRSNGSGRGDLEETIAATSNNTNQKGLRRTPEELANKMPIAMNNNYRTHQWLQQPLPSVIQMLGSPSRNKKSSNAEELDVLSLLSLYWFLGLVLGRVFPQGRMK